MNASPVVLLVDDHADSRDMYAQMLSMFGFDVLHAGDGAAALAHAATRLPSIVVTDLRIPGDVRAVDLCRNFAANGVPVIAVTGVAPGREHDDIRSAGCRAVLLKPVAPDVLVTEITRVLLTQSAVAPAESSRTLTDRDRASGCAR